MTARILIVDDVPANTRLLEARLGAEYYQSAIAHDGETALRLAEEWQPDLLLLDVMMPGIDGFETCRRLKADRRTLHIPVVMITSLDDGAARVRGLEAGADDFLSKPVDFPTLFARVRSLVRLKRLLDEWRMRAETARALGLDADALAPPPVAGSRALVVDDSEAGAAAIEAALAADGILTARARSEAEAMQAIGTVAFDLVVISLTLGADDPLRLASRLRASDISQDIPLLLVAEPEQRDRILRGFDLGANDWLLRPLDPNELRARARNQIRRKVYQARLRMDLGQALEMALTDPLTGLHNRRYMMRHIAHVMTAGATPVAVMMIDIDHFKAINDSYGHPTGDAALRMLADVLRARVRVFDSIARFGGEEFVIVMPGTGQEDAAAAAERLRQSIAAARFTDGGTNLQLTVSIGVACTIPGMSVEALLADSDAALYEAKRGGRNRVVMAETRVA